MALRGPWGFIFHPEQAAAGAAAKLEENILCEDREPVADLLSGSSGTIPNQGPCGENYVCK